MKWDPLEYPYPSTRRVIYGKNGMVASSQPLASQAGLQILKNGGNAIDAAIATAATLTVVEPTANGIGGDAFALFWSEGKLHGINGSGPAPSSITIEAVRDQGHEEMPKVGWIPVTVPGVPGTWTELSEKFGKLPLIEVLKPAIHFAEEGFPVSPVIGNSWQHSYEYYKKQEGDQFKYWLKTFAPTGRPPKIGEIFRSRDHANTLKKIGSSNSKAFYEGELAEKIASFSKEYGGYLRKKDLSNFTPEWVDPVSINYKGYNVWELPPNGQGIIALIALNILKDFDFEHKDSVETYHKQTEALKLAFADGKEYITDPEHMEVKPEELLSDSYAAERRKLIEEEAINPYPGSPPKGDTVYLAAADGDGNMISYIQSNYMGFGSGLVVPNTGISLQNRGNLFSLDHSEANSLAPGKRSYHTIIPGFLTREKKPIGPFGVMGGYMQPQGHLQVIMNSIDFDLNPQAALDAPRWRWREGKTVYVEHGFPQYIAKKLARRGHDIQYSLHSGGFGKGQIIWREDGSLVGGSEPRTDGQIAVW